AGVRRAVPRGRQGQPPARLDARAHRRRAGRAARHGRRRHGLALARPRLRRHRHLRRLAQRLRGAPPPAGRGSAVRVGLDIGGTKTDAVAVADDGTVCHTRRLPTGFGPEAVLATAVEAVERVSEATGTLAAGFASIGIGIPGAVDSATGRVSHAVNLGLADLELGEAL